MRTTVTRLFAALAVVVGVSRPLGAQQSRVTFIDQVILHVTSADSSRVARFALIGAGRSFTGSRTDVVLGDTIYLYTPARFTIRAYTDSAVVVALPDQPTLNLGIGSPNGQKPAITIAGRHFDLLRAASRP